MIIKITIGAVIGGILGYFYYKKIGCPNGSCPITSNRYTSIIYGALIGILISKSF